MPPRSTASPCTDIRKRILGRPAVLWALTNSDARRVECLAGNLDDRRFHIVVLRDEVEVDASTFDRPLDGLTWALDREQCFLDEGWTRVDP